METTINALTVYGEPISIVNEGPQIFTAAWKEYLHHEKYPFDCITYGLYCNFPQGYFSGSGQPFDFVIATERNNGKPKYTIEGGRYDVWDVGSEDPLRVIDVWREIWRSNIPRKFTTDFELYVPGETVKIYLSI